MKQELSQNVPTWNCHKELGWSVQHKLIQGQESCAPFSTLQFIFLVLLLLR